MVPVAFVFADTIEAKVANTVAVLEEAGRRYWSPRRFPTLHRGITAKDYGQAVPVVVTTLEQLQEHGAHRLLEPGHPGVADLRSGARVRAARD